MFLQRSSLIEGVSYHYQEETGSVIQRPLYYLSNFGAQILALYYIVIAFYCCIWYCLCSTPYVPYATSLDPGLEAFLSSTFTCPYYSTRRVARRIQYAVNEQWISLAPSTALFENPSQELDLTKLASALNLPLKPWEAGQGKRIDVNGLPVRILPLARDLSYIQVLGGRSFLTSLFITDLTSDLLKGDVLLDATGKEIYSFNGYSLDTRNFPVTAGGPFFLHRPRPLYRENILSLNSLHLPVTENYPAAIQVILSNYLRR